MPRTVVVLALLGIALLAIPVIYLAATNLSWRIWQPVLSIIGAAVITLFVTLAVTLKETTFAESLYATLVTDPAGQPVDPALVVDADFNLTLRLSEAHSLAQAALKDQSATALNVSEKSKLHKQIIQTAIMETLCGHYADGWAFSFQRPKVLGGFHPGSIGQPITTSAKSSFISADIVWTDLERKNPVAKSRPAGLAPVGLALPEGTVLTIHEIRDAALLEREPMFVLHKKHFFEIAIEIAKGITQIGSQLPFKIRSDAEPTKRLQTETYLVTIRARFFAERAGHPAMESYQLWARGLVDAVRFTVTD